MRSQQSIKIYNNIGKLCLIIDRHEWCPPPVSLTYFIDFPNNNNDHIMTIYSNRFNTKPNLS